MNSHEQDVVLLALAMDEDEPEENKWLPDQQVGLHLNDQASRSPPSGRTCSLKARPPIPAPSPPTPLPSSAKPAPSPPTPLPSSAMGTSSAKPAPSTPSAKPAPSAQPTPLPSSAMGTSSAKPAPTPVPQKPPQDPEDRRRATEELWKAVKEGEDDRAVEAAVEAGADVRARGVCGETPLHEAAMRGSEAAVLYLISRGAELEAKSEYGWTPLHCAAISAHLPCTKLLVERGADLNARTRYGETPLALAVQHNRLTVRQYLESVGGTRRRATEELWKAVKEGEDDKAVEAAVEAGADVRARGECGETPLHEAAMRGSEAAVLYLIFRGAELDAKSEYGWTPLHCAAISAHLPCTKLLVERGADPNARTRYGETPLALAVQYNRLTVQQYLRSVGGTR